MSKLVDVVYWCNSLTELLWARAHLQRELHAKQVLIIGPSGTQAIFEMDDEAVFWLELPNWLVDFKPSWLGHRKLVGWLKESLPEVNSKQIWCWSNPAEHLHRGLASIGFESKVLEVPGEGGGVKTLMAGPSALSISTHHYRAMPANGLKVLVAVHFDRLAEGKLQGLLASIDAALPHHAALAERLQLNLQVTYLGFGEVTKLIRRELAQRGSKWYFGGIEQLVGHLAYADQVVSNSPDITLLCHQMGKPSPDLL